MEPEEEQTGMLASLKKSRTMRGASVRSSVKTSKRATYDADDSFDKTMN